MSWISIAFGERRSAAFWTLLVLALVLVNGSALVQPDAVSSLFRAGKSTDAPPPCPV